MITTIFLILSVSLNLFFLFYVRWLIKNMSSISENLEALWENVKGFSVHVTALHESEMFYGDSTLQELIEHSKVLTTEIRNFKDILIPIEDGEMEMVEEEEEDGRII